MKSQGKFGLPRIALLISLLGLIGPNVRGENGDKKSLADYVDTKIGVLGTGARTSNCVIGPQLPFGCINPSPESINSSPAGYNPQEPTRGYAQLHVSGTGGDGRYGHFLISPQIGVAVDPKRHDSPAENKETKAYYFKSLLERYGITTEISPAFHSAIYRFTFPKSDSASIVIDAAQSVPKDIRLKRAQNVTILENNIQIDKKNRTIRGMIYTRGGWNCTTPYKFYFVATFNKPVSEAGVWKDSTLYGDKDTIARDAKDDRAVQRIGTFCKFKTITGEQLLMKVATSLVSCENAEKYLQSEIPDWDFDRVKTAGMKTWEKQLEKIKIDASEDQKKLFYTAMYHTMVMPRDFTGDNPHWTSDQPFWNDQYAIWDTWRTLYPFQLLINPDMVRDNILSFIDRLKHNGMVRDAFISGNDAGNDQGGNNVDNIIADAYVKGVSGINWNEAYGVMKFDADHERKGDAKNNDIYLKQGWIPSGRMATSYTLEYAYNDYCVATVAKGLGKTDDYKKYLERSNGWINLWNKDLESKGFKGFMDTRNKNNMFENLDPAAYQKSWSGPYYEGTSWTYSYFVPHNIEKLIELMGGKEKFVEKLDFALKNDLIDYGNEPSFLALRSFNHAGRPDMTSLWVHNALQKNFDMTGGLGNDDSGAMSSWYIFSALGFFPNAGQDIYYLNAPLYRKSEITLGNGKKLTIESGNFSEKNLYIQSCKINGKDLNSSIIKHSDIANGGTLTFVLSDKPTDWGKK
jgi:predicted alpha-1,2-mannosidase